MATHLGVPVDCRHKINRGALEALPDPPPIILLRAPTPRTHGQSAKGRALEGGERACHACAGSAPRSKRLGRGSRPRPVRLPPVHASLPRSLPRRALGPARRGVALKGGAPPGRLRRALLVPCHVLVPTRGRHLCPLLDHQTCPHPGTRPGTRPGNHLCARHCPGTTSCPSFLFRGHLSRSRGRGGTGHECAAPYTT